MYSGLKSAAFVNNSDRKLFFTRAVDSREMPEIIPDLKIPSVFDTGYHSTYSWRKSYEPAAFGFMAKNPGAPEK